jgi:hypothetical protein
MMFSQQSYPGNQSVVEIFKSNLCNKKHKNWASLSNGWLTVKTILFLLSQNGMICSPQWNSIELQIPEVTTCAGPAGVGFHKITTWTYRSWICFFISKPRPSGVGLLLDYNLWELD